MIEDSKISNMAVPRVVQVLGCEGIDDTSMMGHVSQQHDLQQTPFMLQSLSARLNQITVSLHKTIDDELNKIYHETTRIREHVATNVEH